MQAKIKISRVIKYVAHYCKACNLDKPPKVCEGEIVNDEIKWAIFGGMYRMSYCPFCGGELPKYYGKINKLEVRE